MKYILIILALGWSGGTDSGVHSSHIEFNTREACMAARTAVMSKPTLAYRTRQGTYEAYCVEKGYESAP